MIAPLLQCMYMYACVDWRTLLEMHSNCMYSPSCLASEHLLAQQ